MRYLYSFILIFAIISCNTQQKNEHVAQLENDVNTTYYLIRHAEKDRSDTSNSNPNLSEAGNERAKRWAAYFSDIPLDQIFSTDLHRTQQTSSYVASEKNIQVRSYDPTDLYNETFQEETRGHHVLIVGHSNTTPQFVNKIIGATTYKDIPDDENGMLYIVRITKDETDVSVKTIN